MQSIRITSTPGNKMTRTPRASSSSLLTTPTTSRTSQSTPTRSRPRTASPSSNPNEESWPFCEDFQTYIDAGKPVLQIEYPPSVEKKGKLSASDSKYYCTAEDEDKGFSKIIKWASAQLDGWGQYCGEEPFRTPAAKYE
ncbi:hypothetical protein FSOLCH5_000481 [Fusarium solani]